MRSASIANLLRTFDLHAITLKGGYKGFRREIADIFHTETRNVIILGGKTGSGKVKKSNRYIRTDVCHLFTR